MRTVGSGAVALALLGTLSLGCARLSDLAWWREAPGPEPDPSYGVELVTAESVIRFQERIEAFYSRVSKRRFNTYATYQDRVLRQHFRSDEAYSDYYADLSQSLEDAHFEKNRALAAVVKEFALEGPGRARVQVLMKGDNGLPLRWWDTLLEREDRWERLDGVWWVIPGKL